MSIPEASKCGFTFKVVFLDEDEREVDFTKIDILVDSTDDSEEDRYSAYTLADDEAEGLLEEYAAESFEISLANAW